ncbi:Uncharacterized protein FWK35_00005762 [Aphis craccivora]|uniref:Uncharacterized protein n=1 Tax=Aphis craccivora TaxID=307492 RepID=A0A6G0ZBS3_APHCR|nr:Uncharacterized protein FWK35_00005762 [Aphis craccivora]
MARGREVNKSGNLQDGAWRRYSWWPERMTPRALCVLYPSSSTPLFFPPAAVQHTNSPPYRCRLNLTRTPPSRMDIYTHCTHTHTHHIHTRLLLLYDIYMWVCVLYILVRYNTQPRYGLYE